MKHDTEEELLRMISDLDNAIRQIVDNPISFGDSPVIQLLAVSCDSLTRLAASDTVLAQSSRTEGTKAHLQKRAALLWQVRQRAGRLQMLMDSAARFYNSCFSTSQPEELAYGVHGEWNAVAHVGHLIVDC